MTQRSCMVVQDLTLGCAVSVAFTTEKADRDGEKWAIVIHDVHPINPSSTLLHVRLLQGWLTFPG